MSIIVKEITKKFGSQKALDNVSFTIKPGQIVGLLGPNGAGKSTMMKILTCFLPPTSGEVYVYNFDVLEDPIEVKKIIGYLPEHNPLYPEMYVKEFLEFICGIHKIKNTGQRIVEMIDITGLGAEQNKKIGALSKGYKQRVGLAQALIHNPQVLILDEPTSGLDPNQIIEIRNLIKNIGSEKTVMLSTHIMQEVEAICDRAIIITDGKIVADDSTDNYRKLSQEEEIILVEFNNKIPDDFFSEIKGIKNIVSIKENSWKITSEKDIDIRKEIMKNALDNNLTVISLQKQEYTLEEVFQKLTKNKK